MKPKIDKNEIRKKQRRFWQIKPFTRIMEDKQKYERESIKKETQEIMDRAMEEVEKAPSDKNENK
jgi:hypothetical protein